MLMLVKLTCAWQILTVMVSSAPRLFEPSVHLFSIVGWDNSLYFSGKGHFLSVYNGQS